MEGWGEFYVAEVGAAAAIAGLLFVAISINIEKILAQPLLPGRAAQTLAIVAGALVVGSFALLPRQPAWAFGLEALGVSLLVALSGWVQVQTLRHAQANQRPLPWLIYPLMVLFIAVLPGLIGGVMLMSGAQAGAYLIAVGVILGLLAALLGGWVLLVEILR